MAAAGLASRIGGGLAEGASGRERPTIAVGVQARAHGRRVSFEVMREPLLPAGAFGPEVSYT